MIQKQSNEYLLIELVTLRSLRKSLKRGFLDVRRRMCVRTVTIYVYGYAEFLSMVYISTNILLISRYQQHRQQAEQSQQEGKFHTLD